MGSFFFSFCKKKTTHGRNDRPPKTTIIIMAQGGQGGQIRGEWQLYGLEILRAEKRTIKKAALGEE